MKLKLLLGMVLILFCADFSHARLKVDFAFKDLEGNTYTPATLKGKPVVMYIGSTF